MTTELWLLFASVVLGFVHIFAQAYSVNRERGLRWNAGPRDEPMPPLTGVAGRLQRALQNFLETFPLYAAAVFISYSANVTDSRAGAAFSIWPGA